MNLIKPHWIRIAGLWYPRGGIPIDVFWQNTSHQMMYGYLPLIFLLIEGAANVYIMSFDLAFKDISLEKEVKILINFSSVICLNVIHIVGKNGSGK